MGIETFPVIEGHDINAFFLNAEWKWLSDCLDEPMDNIARSLGLTPLSDFYNYSRQDAIDSLSEEDVEEEQSEAELEDGIYYRDGYALWSLERHWFDPAKALHTTHGLIQFLRSHPEDLRANKEYAESFIYILEALEVVLLQAKLEDKLFYLKS